MMCKFKNEHIWFVDEEEILYKENIIEYIYDSHKFFVIPVQT